MERIERIKLSEFFTLFAPRYVLGTTYTISLAFFESVVLPCIKRENLHGCLLVCDKFGFQRAIQESTALRAVSKTYSVVPAPHSHSFHPKLWIMSNAEEIAVLVGSGNLTQSGFIHNRELFEVIRIQKGQPLRHLARDVLRFVSGLRGMLDRVEGRSLPAQRIIARIEAEISELEKSTVEAETIGERLLSSFDGPFPGQWNVAEEVRHLHIAAPFFGGSVEGIKLLKESLKPRKTSVHPAIHPGDSIDLSWSELTSLPATVASTLKLQAPDGPFAHFKLFGWETKSGDRWIFSGSPNCTKAALSGKNIEAGLLRTVDKHSFDLLFKEWKPLAKLVQRPPNHETDAEAWLAFWAVNRGLKVEVSLLSDHSGELPLKNVTIEITSGAAKKSIERNSLFNSGTVAHLDWADLADEAHERGGTHTLRIEGQSQKGKTVSGVAFIDDDLSISSSPLHRNAWKGMVDMLSGEGLPDPYEVSSVFELLTEILNASAEESEDPAGSEASGAPAENTTEPAASASRRAIWPPQVLKDGHHASLQGHSWHSIAWFQKLLGTLLATEQNQIPTGEVVRPVVDDEAEEEEAKLAEARGRIESAAEKLWAQAEANLADLQGRVHGMVITERLAPRLVPVAVAVLLSTLAIRRTLIRSGAAPLAMGTTRDVLSRFLPILVGDREQDEDYVRPPGSPYFHDTFPSAIEDLAGRLHYDLPKDLAMILAACFALLKAESDKGSQNSFPTVQWALAERLLPTLRDVCAQQTGDVSNTVLKRIVCPDDAAQSSAIEAAAQKLAEASWRELPGVRDLRFLRDVARLGQDESPRESPSEEIERYLGSFRNRVRRHGETGAFLKANRFDQCCRMQGCSNRGIKSPVFNKLRGLMPVICPVCGAVSVPEQLPKEEVFNERL